MPKSPKSATKSKDTEQKKTSPKIVETVVRKYSCRCYQVGNKYEMWILDPRNGTYSGPHYCTEEQCRKCNMSQAEII
jgi:hypothetical protein